MFGGMGCGKTVTTSYVIDHIIRLNQHTLPRHLICYHYCNTDENSDTVYIFLSLLQQLFYQQPGLKIKFNTWYEATRPAMYIDPTRSSQMLGHFLAECVEKLDRTLILVIDAVDECNDQSLPELLTLLRGISEKTSRLKVFLSSRPGEGREGQLHGAAQIALLPDPARDAVIVDFLVNTNLKELQDEPTRDLVISRLRDAADGCAI